MAPSRRKGGSKAAAAAAAARQWKVGDLVLAKVKGFPAWPATVTVFFYPAIFMFKSLFLSVDCLVFDVIFHTACWWTLELLVQCVVIIHCFCGSYP